MSKTLFMLDEAGMAEIVNSGGLNGRATPLVLLQSAWSGEGPYSLALAVTGVTSDTSACHAVISPAPGSLSEYGECGVYVAAQTEGALLFYAESMPENDLIVNILIVTPNGYTSVVPNPEYGYLRYDEPQALTDEQKINVITALGLNTEQPETGVQMELLWENASPSSNFAAQTVSLNLKEYSHIGVEPLLVVAYPYSLGIFIFSKSGRQARIRTHDGIFVHRGISSISDTGVSFTDGSSWASYGGSSSTANNRVIPYRIYGIKGVS